MSTIIASNISDGTTSVPSTYVVNGSAKAWVNFNGTGTIAARDSFNVASLTDNGVGDYSVNVSSAFDVADYAISLSNSRQPTIGNPPGFINIFTNNSTGLDATPTTSAFRLGLLDYGVGGRDVTYVCTFAHGDLA
jgi:hypothetical protein